MKKHRFYAYPKGGKKGRKGQMKFIRRGSRFPGSDKQGSIRRPL